MKKSIFAITFAAVFIILFVSLFIFTSSAELSKSVPVSRTLSPDESYFSLSKALAIYRLIAENGGWPELPQGTLLFKGKIDDQVIILRNRLLISGDIEPDKTNDIALFDTALEDAVIRFQKRHGLNADGRVGRKTRDALNVSAQSRVRQIELNLERLLLSKGTYLNRYLMVNIADFRLDVIENNNIVISMKVIVGKPSWETPILHEKMTHIVFNPSWNIPASIALKEVLPKIRSEKDYLKMQDIIIYDEYGNDAREIDPDSIDWSKVSDDKFNFNLRQKPGPLNPLGRIKFIFPNWFSIYMHDTPSKGYFSNESRGFSHGCIRLERPIELSEYLLKDDPEWTAEKIQEAISKGREKYVKLPESVDVNIIYLTAWVDPEGQVQFRNDIYGKDKNPGKNPKT